MTPIRILCSAMLVAVFAHLPTQAEAAFRTVTVTHYQSKAPQCARGSAKHKADFSWFKRKHKGTRQDGLKTEPLGLISLMLASGFLLGVLFYLPFYWSPIGILLSIISFIRIKLHPDKWKGTQVAICGFVLNTIGLLIMSSLMIFLFLVLFA